MTAVRNVLISGASIAGPALAYWLGHYGVKATVVEKAPSLRSGGYAIDLRGKAVDVAERMNLLESVRRMRTQVDRISVVDVRGRRKAGFAAGAEQYAERSVEILRGDLVSLICDATDAEYRFGDTITALDQTADGVRATFAEAEPQTFDLVVGADGLHSNVRGIAFGPEAPYRRFLNSYICIFTMPNHLEVDREVLMCNTPNRFAAVYHSPRAEGAKGMLLHRTDEESDVDRGTREDQMAYMRGAFAGMGGQADSVLNEMGDADDFYFDSVTQIKMDAWSQGRVTLLGDAGYGPSPMSGQGTSLALVGAHILASELARSDDHASALAAYEKRMRPYVDANQAIADPGLAFLAPSSSVGIAARNLLLRAGPLLSALSKFDTKLMKAAEAVDLDA